MNTTQVLRQFSHTQLEYKHDNLTIYDGYDNSSSSVKFSGWYLPDPFYSTGHHLYIEMNADGDVQWPGFLATYESVCPETAESGRTFSRECNRVLNDDTGILKSPNFPLDYPNSVLCSWRITVPDGCKIKLNFLHFALESGYDALIIYDGYNTSSSSVTLTGWHLPDAYQSTGQSLFIKMKTDEDIQRSGFLATYTSATIGEVVQWRCSHILNNYTGVIESPNFPSDYPNLMNCSWRVGLPPGCTIKLNISSFALESNYDTLNIYDGYDSSSNLVRFTGYDLPDPFYSTGQYLYIEMNTDRDVQKSGFYATYTSNLDTSLHGLAKQLFTTLSNIAMTIANMINA
ncbi:Deleted in malignant brain tumors 1 protein [Clonorchis sinensis]|uniref:Deleted in malignant brain tumors 1 protein n=1 Tax=Clonorchis sinensis TaxID=79923 RepID=A0A8T1MH78_CLOSI|nr:Deleted in malignant brain tumors 1 protein [Clonorchis sinensis]